MAQWIAQYWLQTAFGAIIALLTWLAKRQYTRQKAIEYGIQALLRDRLVQAYYHYIERDNISLHGLEAVDSMYKEYHNLGGNGAVTKLMEDMHKLKVIDS